MASARLRKAFHYPESDDEGNGRNELDEEAAAIEQERIITKLRQEDEKRNAIYTRAFAILPLVAALAYVPRMFSEASTSRWLICLLSMASLLIVSYTIVYQPLQRPDRKGKKPMRLVEQENASLQRHTRLANGVLAAFIGVVGLKIRGTDPNDFFWLYCIIPGVLSLICYMAEKSMISVDLDELERLKYDLKGA
ncbi:hypothetical protein KEM56_000189 [Ascosphaera pollenicola]|nr:hypothetical protein KEM56_000189 [Ascosphaera pollenicola]